MGLGEQLADFLKSKIKVGQMTPKKFPIAFPMYKVGKTPTVYQLYFMSGEKGNFYISDEGATIAELDTIFELGEPDVIKNLVAILHQYGCRKEGKNIVVDCTPKDIHIKMSYLIQAISFMLNMKIFYV
jgi:hypothetical protein